jgi:hypothetical protein
VLASAGILMQTKSPAVAPTGLQALRWNSFSRFYSIDYRGRRRSAEGTPRKEISTSLRRRPATVLKLLRKSGINSRGEGCVTPEVTCQVIQRNVAYTRRAIWNYLNVPRTARGAQIFPHWQSCEQNSLPSLSPNKRF